MLPFSSIIPDFIGHKLSSPQFNLSLVEVLGRGAYGVVYLARNTSGLNPNPPFFAVKCLLRLERDTHLGIAQTREIAIHKRLSHLANVVTLHEVIDESHYTFLVMDYCPGGDLFGAIAERPYFYHNDSAIKRSFVQILDAMEACHSLGISHRDLKPENILCSADKGQIYIADFGLATKTCMSSMFGYGSSDYMSPECIGDMTSEVPYSTAISDVWSLGMTLLNMITSRTPWRMASPQTDEAFQIFLEDGAPCLSHTFPMSRDAAELFVRIFDPNPATRITIPDLRKAIVEIETFYSEHNTSHHSSSFLHLGDTRMTASRTVDSSSYTLSTSSSNASIMAIAPSRNEQYSMFANNSSLSNGINLEAFPAPPPLTADRDNSDSDTESEGPTTPVTRAVDPAIQVPEDLNLGVARGQEDIVRQPAALLGLQQKKQAVIKLWTSLSSGYGSKVQKPVQRMKAAVQRVKALA